MVKIVDVAAEIYNLNNIAEICTHIEKCGRICYKSENLITDGTAVPFIKGILKSGHESVTEHANVIFSMPNTERNRNILTMRDVRGLNVSIEEGMIVVSGNIRAFRDIARSYDIHDFLLALGNPLFYIKENAEAIFCELKIEGVQSSRFSAMHNYLTTHAVCDLGAYKDVTRHRLASFSIESTRYCNYSKGKFGSELTMIKPCNIEENSEMYGVWFSTMQQIESAYMQMAEMGAKGDQLRMMLPHSIKADMMMTANVIEWQHVFSLRCHLAAHPSVQQVMKKVLAEFYKVMPQFFEKQYQQFCC